jgi:hypothetical protein
MLEQEQSQDNLLYFECSSMRELHDSMKNWQDTNHQQFLALSIQLDSGNFCCIALTHPQNSKQQQTTKYEDDMDRFRHKALKHVGVTVNFESSAIPLEKVLAIQLKLKKCKSQAEVTAVFAEEF